MKFTLLLGALLLAAVPVRADSISVFGDAAFQNFAFDSNGIPTVSLGTVESVDVSFIYNTTSQQISDMNFNSNGPLGPFTFLGINPSGTVFNWVSSQAELEMLELTPNPGGVTGLGAHNLDMICMSQLCNDDFNDSYSPAGPDAHSATTYTWLSADDPSDPPSPTPEPSSLALLGVGLVGIVSLRKLIA